MRQLLFRDEDHGPPCCREHLPTDDVVVVGCLIAVMIPLVFNGYLQFGICEIRSSDPLAVLCHFQVYDRLGQPRVNDEQSKFGFFGNPYGRE